MRRCTSLLVSSALVAAACGSDRALDAGAPVHEARGGSSGSGGEAASGGDGNAAGESSAPGGAGVGGADDAGGGDAGSNVAGAPSAAGAGGHGRGTDPPPVDELCPREPSFGSAEKLSLSTDADERFGGITPDELVIAWTVTVDETVTLFVASRENVDADFGAPVSAAIEAALDDRVALSADGLRVAFVNGDRRGFSVMSRPTLDDAFGVATAGEFALLDATGGGLPPGQNYADPVLAGDGVSFYYSQYGEGVTDTLRISSRLSDTDPWPAGGPLAGSALGASEAGRLAPSGASRDGRTLFLWDPAGTEVVAFVDPESAKFEIASDIGPRRGAAPNGPCTRLYYAAPDPSLDLFVVPVGE